MHRATKQLRATPLKA